MREKTKTLLAIIASVSAILVILISSIDFHAFNRSFYDSEYKEMETAHDIGMTQSDLMKSTNTLLDYLQDDRDDIKVRVPIKGNKEEVFNVKEEMHMIDVKNLYQNVLSLRLISFGLLILSLSWLFIRLKKKAWDTLAYRFIQVSIAFVIILVGLGIVALCDFTMFWTAFHQIFFTNDLWILNPATDIMINMFPQDFFFHMVMRITITFVLIYGTLIIGSIVYIKKWIKREHIDYKQAENLPKE